MTTTMQAAEIKLPQCPHCGKSFDKLNDGKIPPHDFPEPFLSICKGAGKPPRRKKSALWKDDPGQQERDFLSQCEFELRIYGFAVVKEIAVMRGKPNGELKCPLCGNTVRYSIAECNGHCHASCGRPGCIKAME